MNCDIDELLQRSLTKDQAIHMLLLSVASEQNTLSQVIEKETNRLHAIARSQNDLDIDREITQKLDKFLRNIASIERIHVKKLEAISSIMEKNIVCDIEEEEYDCEE